MAELQRSDALDRLLPGDRRLLRIDFADRALGVAERDHPRDAGRCVVADLAAYVLGFQSSSDLIKLGRRIGLKRQSDAARLFSFLELYHQVAELGGQEGAPVQEIGRASCRERV